MKQQKTKEKTNNFYNKTLVKAFKRFGNKNAI